jgi:3-oxoacid CoA-transferase subunit B
VPLTREQMARRAAQELCNGDYVNLGVGLPTLVANLVPPDVEVILHSGHGILGIGPLPTPEQFDPDLLSVAGQPATILPGAAFASTYESFGWVRSGRIDVSILGALQVSERGDVANWMVPGSPPRGMGGAMDIVVGVKRLIILMEHVTRSGEKRIVRECTMPLTGVACVKRIITDYCVLDVTPRGLVLVELAPDVTLPEVQALTDAKIVEDREIRHAEM